MHPDLIEEFLLDFSANWSVNTRKWYLCHLRSFADYLAGNDIDVFAMQPRGIAHYLACLRQSDMSPHTRRSRYQAVRKLFRWLTLMEHIQVDVFAEAENIGLVRLPAIPRYVNRHKPLDVIKNMIQTAKIKESWREAAIFTLMIDTGIRRGELINLNYSDVSFPTGEIFVIGKGSHERYVFPSQITMDLLQKYLDTRRETGSKALFTSLQKTVGKPWPDRLEERTLNVIFNKWLKICQVPEYLNITPHTLRHTYATNFYNSGGDIYTLSRLLGHANIQTTIGYISRLLPNLREQALKHSPVSILQLDD